MRQVYFNELSLFSNEHRSAAIASMESLIQCLTALSRTLKNICLVSPASLSGVDLAPNFKYEQWKNSANRDSWVLLELLLSKAPTYDFDRYRQGDIEYLFDGFRALGLAAALDNDGLSVSISGTESLRQDWLTLNVVAMRADDENRVLITEETATVAHAWNAELAVHESWIREQTLLEEAELQASLLSVDDVIAHCSGVEFLPSAATQFRRLEGEPLRRVMETILLLDASVIEWAATNNATPSWRTKVTPESQTRINSGLVTFQDTDGNRYAFGLHARYTPGAGRIHFRLDPTRKIIRIAYIGVKLL